MKWILHFDGGIHPNPGGVPRFGFHLDSEDGDPIAHGSGRVADCEECERTNNSAELFALLFALRAALAAEFETPDEILVRGDSKLVIQAASGRWQLKAPHLRRLTALILAEVDAIRRHGVRVSFKWVPRKKNAKADALAETKSR